MEESGLTDSGSDKLYLYNQCAGKLYSDHFCRYMLRYC